MPFSFRALRHRWGIAAPKMTVRTHVAWYWRALGLVAVLSISLTLALWMYDAGREFAGFDATAASEELANLRGRINQLEEEATRLRSTFASSESRVQIEKTAQEQLVKQLKTVEAENARLREDLAFFENLAAGRAEDKLAVSRFKVESDAVPGEYRYRVLVTQGGKEREFQGRLQLVVSMRQGGRDVTLMIPDERSPETAAYRIHFRRFFSTEGMFKVDPSAVVTSVQVRVYELGVGQPRASHSFNLT
jgi:septal ring factor EnvC (AmiA/AmiB activator)